MADLLPETVSLIAELNRKNSGKDVMAIVVDVVQELGASKQLVPAMRAVGGTPSEFIQAVAAEVRRIRSINQPK